MQVLTAIHVGPPLPNRQRSLRLILVSASAGGDEDPLLDELEARRTETQTKPAAVAQLFLLPELRKPLMVVCFAMLTQQVSGTYDYFHLVCGSDSRQFQVSMRVRVSIFA